MGAGIHPPVCLCFGCGQESACPAEAGRSPEHGGVGNLCRALGPKSDGREKEGNEENRYERETELIGFRGQPLDASKLKMTLLSPSSRLFAILPFFFLS